MAKGKSKYEMRNGITPNGLVVVEVIQKKTGDVVKRFISEEHAEKWISGAVQTDLMEKLLKSGVVGNTKENRELAELHSQFSSGSMDDEDTEDGE
jgi:ribosomal protein S19E (S16A)